MRIVPYEISLGCLGVVLDACLAWTLRQCVHSHAPLLLNLPLSHELSPNTLTVSLNKPFKPHNSASLNYSVNVSQLSQH